MNFFPTSQVKPLYYSLYIFISITYVLQFPSLHHTHTYSLYTLLVSVVTPCFTLTPNDLELGTSTKGEPVELIILGSDTSLIKTSVEHMKILPSKGLSG